MCSLSFLDVSDAYPNRAGKAVATSLPDITPISTGTTTDRFTPPRAEEVDDCRTWYFDAASVAPLVPRANGARPDIQQVAATRIDHASGRLSTTKAVRIIV
jgi:hypothetical protein